METQSKEINLRVAFNYFFVALACHLLVLDGSINIVKLSTLYLLSINLTNIKNQFLQIQFVRKKSSEKFLGIPRIEHRGCWVSGANATSVLCRLPKHLHPNSITSMHFLNFVHFLHWYYSLKICSTSAVCCLFHSLRSNLRCRCNQRSMEKATKSASMPIFREWLVPIYKLFHLILRNLLNNNKNPENTHSTYIFWQ